MKEKKDFLGEFEELVLLAIRKLSKNAYGVTIRQVIEEKAGRPTSYGAIYATLERLEKKGYISSRQGSPTAERGGRAKKYYKVEAAGEKALNDTETARSNITGLRLDRDPVGNTT